MNKFTESKLDIPLALLVSAEGLEKDGKTHWSLGVPSPCVVISMDPGTKRAIRNAKRMWPKKRYQLFEIGTYRPPVYIGDPSQAVIQQIAEGARPYWNNFRKAYDWALTAPDVRSVVVDTGTAAIQLLILARMGKESVGNWAERKVRGLVNAEFGGLFGAAKNAEKNVVFIHRLKDKYEAVLDAKGKPKLDPRGQPQEVRNGYQMDGWKSANFEVDTIVRLSRNGNAFRCQIMRSGFNADADGLVFEDEACTFASVASAIFENDESEWR